MKYQNVYENVYKKGLNAGFQVTKVRDYPDDRGRLNSEIYMNTPYFDSKGNAITGYAVVPITHDKNALRDANTVEFYADGHNMDYMQENDGYVETDGYMYDSHGNIVVNKIVQREQLRELMGQFAAAASEYPHVASWDEYKTLQERTYKRLKIDDEVTQSDYAKYLDKKQGELRQGIKHIGENSTKLDVARLYDSVREDNDISDEVLDDMAKSFGDDGMSL